MRSGPTVHIFCRPIFVLTAVVLLICGGSSHPVRAQQDEPVTVTASARPMTVGTSETVAYVIQVKGAPLSMVETPEPPPTKGLVLQRTTPSTQRNVSFVNGQLSRSVTFQWTYEPMQAGTARFEPTTVVVRGASYETEAIDITVVSQPQRSRRSPSGSGSTSPSAISDQDLFIRARASDQQIYLNEQAIITYRLYFREGVQLRHSRLASAWDATGFWREELDVESRPIPRTAYVDGTAYQTIVLKRVAIFPTRTGTLQVDPLEIETEARATARLRDPSDPFAMFRGSYESVTRASNALTIDVRPLPSDPPPAFNGAVGSFRMRTRVDEHTISTGRAVQMTVNISGTGNLATLEAPTFTPPASVETYDPKVSTSVDRSGTRIEGAKTFTYTLVPQRSGTLALPPVTFSYFDPTRRRYRTLRSSPADIHVTEPESTAADSSEQARLTRSETSSAVSTTRWESEGRPLYLNPWAYAAVLVPLLVAGGVLAYWRRTDQTAASPSPPRERSNRLEPAQRHLRAGSPDAFYAALERAVLGFIGDRLGVAPAGITRARLNRELADHAVPERIRDAIFELLDVCDRARFSPAQTSKSGMKQALTRARQIIDYLDGRLPDAPSPS